MLLEPICYDLLDVSLARNLFPDDPGEGGEIQFDLAKTDQSLWLGVRDKPFFAAGDILKVKDQVRGLLWVKLTEQFTSTNFLDLDIRN